MAEKGPNRRVANSLVALSSAAILAVYAAGYVRTRRAADRFDFEAARRKRVPVAQGAAAPPAVVPATPAASASPDLTPKAEMPLPPPIEAPRMAAAPSPSGPVAQTTFAASETAQPKEPVAAPSYEPSDGDVVAEPAALPAVQYKDGTYSGWGACRHGDLQAEVVIEQGRIMEARIAQCLTRYPCSWIDRLVPEVVSHQGPPVSFVSGASESSDALYYAVMDALSKAK